MTSFLTLEGAVPCCLEQFGHLRAPYRQAYPRSPGHVLGEIAAFWLDWTEQQSRGWLRVAQTTF